MTPSVAILALSLAVKPPLALVREAERLNLPPAASAVRLEARPFTREWILHLPPAAVPATLFRLRGSSRICPEVTSTASTVVLRCVTSRVRATVVRDVAGTGIAVFRLSVPSWRAEDEGPPLVPFDLVAANIGECPGDRPEVQGECRLAAGDQVGARELFRKAVEADGSSLAHLRLGDFALRDDDPDAAVSHWSMARKEAPWGRLASFRLCELEPKCLASDTFEAVYNAAAVEDGLRADVVLRRARMAALDGDLVNTARRLSAEAGPEGACQADMAWCRHVILLALQLPGPDGLEALTAYLDLYARRDGPLALELARAAALQAERAGAPVFAANLLASTTGTVPPAGMDAHLRRVAGLFIQGNDWVRADEIIRYARSRLGEAGVKDAGWTAMRKAVRAVARDAVAAKSLPSAEPSAEAEPPAAPADLDLAGARAAVEAARLVDPPTPPPNPKEGAKP